MLAVLMRTLALRRRLDLEEHESRMQQANEKPIRDICRTCLSTNNLNPLFDPGLEEKRSSELELVTGIIIKPDDGYPQKICNECMTALNDALRFRKRSNKAQRALIKLDRQNGKTRQKRIKTEVVEVEFCPEDDHLNGDDDDTEEKADGKVEKKKREKKKITEEDLKCKQCNKEFRNVSSCRAHMRSHDVFVVCEECGKKCRNDYVLTLHKRAKHNMEKIHKCKHCNYEGSSKEALTIHLRRHTGEKPYVCDSCGASFHRRSNLVQHIAIHLPEKNFKCPFCGKTFFSKKFVNSHIFKTHQEKRYLYKCIECHNQFRTTDSVRKHMLRAHGITKDQQGPVFRVPRSKN